MNRYGDLALPLSALSVLIAISKYQDAARALYFPIPVVVLCVALAVIGVCLIAGSTPRMRHYDRLVREIKLQRSVIE